MSLLESPAAQELLKDSTLLPSGIRNCRRDLATFLRRYLPRFYRKEQREHAKVCVAGLLSDLQRKTCLPVAIEREVKEKPLQYFVGLGQWDDEALMAELRQHVTEELASAHGSLIFDASGFPKKGQHSCGVKRQWCGRLGKIENCQVGVFMAYASEKGHGPLDRRLYLPEDWAADQKRRTKCHVPAEVVFQTKLEIALQMLFRYGPQLPHAWVLGDDEFGRSAEFRAALRREQERYLLDVPCNTLVRDLEQARPRRRKAGHGRKKEVPFRRADTWLKRQAPARWEHLKVRDGEKGPLKVQALRVRVKTKQDGCVGLEETLLVMRTVEPHPRTSYCLTNAPAEVSLEELVRAKHERHRVEQLFEEAKGETGLAHYEVRGWQGWHHHITLAFLALWFCLLEKRRLGKKLRR
jgi:SRSO17 transposase